MVLRKRSVYQMRFLILTYLVVPEVVSDHLNGSCLFFVEMTYL